MRPLVLIILGMCTLCMALAQGDNSNSSREIDFPDIPGYKTLATDLHIHTVFSDGNVWPSIRVQEALRDKLDAVSMTDHIEYLPYRADIPPVDRNRSYQVALEAAAESEILVVMGTELTRDLPPGHSNAIFLSDVNKFVLDDPVDQFEEAQRQEAFVFWNHPSWEGQQRNTIATLTDIHKDLINRGLLHGIEVVNGKMYSEHALQIALDQNLTIMGVSDIHDLVDWDYGISDGGHRTTTLVFAQEKSIESLKEALFERRTVAYYNNHLVGRPEFMEPLLREIIEIQKVHKPGAADVLSVTIKNNSNLDLMLVNRSDYAFHHSADVITIGPQGQKELWLQSETEISRAQVEFEILNGIIAPKTHPVIAFEIADR